MKSFGDRINHLRDKMLGRYYGDVELRQILLKR